MPEPGEGRTFRVSEAREMLPRIDAQLGAMQEARSRATEARALIDAIRRSATGNGGSTHADTRQLEERFRGHAARLRELAEGLESMGVQVKDLERGLVDWLAEREGRQVLLCWLRGEPDVGWWHELSDGFAGRQAIVEEEWD